MTRVRPPTHPWKVFRGYKERAPVCDTVAAINARLVRIAEEKRTARARAIEARGK